MVASQIKAKARESLTGKWGKAALFTLTYSIIVFVINFICGLVPIIGNIALLAISTPISYGFIVSFIKLKRGEEVEYTDFLTNGFSSFGKVWGVIGNIILKMILPICLVVISIILLIFCGVAFSGAIVTNLSVSQTAFIDASTRLSTWVIVLAIVGFILYIASIIYVIVKSFLYSLSFYILNDNPELSGKEIVNESERLMKGHRWNLVWLSITFIGWAILASIPFGIGMLWLIPYVAVATICFYEELAGKNDTTVIETETKSE